jgi:hypothetical protein
MPKFSDNESREWDLRLDVSTVRAIRSALGVDLARVFSDRDQLQRLHDDVCLMVDVIYEIIRTQADARGVTAEQFGHSLAGDVLSHAIEAFEEAIVDFLPQSDRRSIVRRMIAAGRAAQKQATLRLENALRDGLLETGIAAQMAEVDAQIETLKQTTDKTTKKPKAALATGN